MEDLCSPYLEEIKKNHHSAHSAQLSINLKDGWYCFFFTFVATIITISKIMIKECLQRNPIDDVKNYNGGGRNNPALVRRIIIGCRIIIIKITSYDNDNNKISISYHYYFSYYYILLLLFIVTGRSSGRGKMTARYLWGVGTLVPRLLLCDGNIPYL